MQTILAGTLAASGYNYVLRTTELQGGKYELVIGPVEKPMFCRYFESTKIGYIEARKWLNALQDEGPFEIAKLAQTSIHPSQSAAFG
jgi:hypothetical protein